MRPPDARQIGKLFRARSLMGNPEATLALVENDFPASIKYVQPGEQGFLKIIAAQTYASLGPRNEAQERAMQALPRSRTGTLNRGIALPTAPILAADHDATYVQHR